MDVTPRPVLGAVAYGATFCLLLPWLLWLWAAHSEVAVTWPVLVPAWLGWPLAALAAVWIGAAMVVLWRQGGGLPMNAFPPQNLCTSGPYRWQAHPIYAGFVVICFGVAAARGSAFGCYVLAPVVALGAVALVLGYEGPALARRFPHAAHRPWLALPTGRAPLTARDRLAVLLLVLAPWLVLYRWVVAIGPARDAVAPWLPGEEHWPVLPASYFVYASSYPLVALAPFWTRDARALADFARAGRAAIVLHTFLYLVVPVVVVPRGLLPTNWYGELLAWEAARESTGAGALPSFHVTWALLTAVLASRSFPRWRALAWAWAAATAISCSTTGMHALADIASGASTGALVHCRTAVWRALRGAAERLANSFRTWRIGPVRIFAHAPYAGFAAALVVATMAHFAPAGSLPAVLAVGAAAVVGAALWAQWVEGAAASLRPFGYYGAVVGAACALAGLALGGVDAWPLAGGLCVAAPFARAIGRLRCLVQGCCHGRPAPAAIGIVCRAPLARVVRLAGLGGVAVHATQLYSALWNVPCGIVLLRCAQLGQPPSVVAGLYLLLNGLGRFVEEAYRGEPQTRRWFGLAEYQVWAIFGVVAGAVCTCVPSHWPAPAPATPGVWLGALGMGLCVAFAMGVDFPASDRRFARLLK